MLPTFHKFGQLKPWLTNRNEYWMFSSLPIAISIIIFSTYKQLRQSHHLCIYCTGTESSYSIHCTDNHLILTLTFSNLFCEMSANLGICHRPCKQPTQLHASFALKLQLISTCIWTGAGAGNPQKDWSENLKGLFSPHWLYQDTLIWCCISSLKRFQDGWQLMLGSEELINYANILLAYSPHRAEVCALANCRWAALHAGEANWTIQQRSYKLVC